jgi:aquaporin Z
MRMTTHPTPYLPATRVVATAATPNPAAATVDEGASVRSRLRGHWPEYLIEAWALGTFMVSATLFTVVFEHPSSPVRQALADGDLRRALIGLAMGLTAIGLIYSPWGQRSGAHMNPAVTLTFLRLGRVRPVDAAGYIVAQCAGGLAGVLLVYAALGATLADPSVEFAVTQPGTRGPWVALAAEFAISTLLMVVVLTLSSRPAATKFTGLAAGALVATFIGVEAPLSGMSMNPARTLASAWPAHVWTAFWVYLLAPVAGMQFGAWLHDRFDGARAVPCAKLMHGPSQRCIHCGYAPPTSPGDPA